MKYSIIKSRIGTNLGAQIAKKKKHALFFDDVPKLSVPKLRTYDI